MYGPHFRYQRDLLTAGAGSLRGKFARGLVELARNRGGVVDDKYNGGTDQGRPGGIGC